MNISKYRVRVIIVGFIIMFMAISSVTAFGLWELKKNSEEFAQESLERRVQIMEYIINKNGELHIRDGKLMAGNYVIDGNYEIVDKIQEIYGGTATIFRGDIRVSTNVMTKDGIRAVGTKLENPVHDAVFNHNKNYKGETDILGSGYYSFYHPLANREGKTLGVLYAGVKKNEFLMNFYMLIRMLVLVSIVLLVVFSLLMYLFSRMITKSFLMQYKMQEDLKYAHDEYESLLAAINSILIGVSVKDIVTHWNSEAEKAFNIDSSVIIGATVTKIGLNWEWDRIYEGICNAISEDSSVNITEVKYSPIIGSAEKNQYLNLKITPVKNKQNDLQGFLIVGDDITESRSMRIRTTQSQKLETIGQLAAGVAHEINTPTQYISDNIHFMNKYFPVYLSLTEIARAMIGKPTKGNFSKIKELIESSDLDFLNNEIPKAINQTLEGIVRISKIVTSMKQFSHPGTQNKEPYNINRIIENVVAVSKNEWKYVSELTTDLAPDVPVSMCYPNELSQVFLNMVVNAAHAIAEKIGDNPDTKGLIFIRTKFDNNMIRIDIRDSGNGISDDIKNKVFDPFFTTKGVGKGSGQGLAISRTVIYEMHKGIIDIDTAIGEGTTFKIWIPFEKPADIKE